jgi:DNA-binding Lrp family transcriptional regulator
MGEVDTPIEGHIRLPNSFIWRGWLEKISGNELKVYCVIKSFNPSFPSYKMIKEITGISRDAVRRAITRLVELGLISYIRGDCENNNVYTVLEIPRLELSPEVGLKKAQGRLELSPGVGLNYASNNTKRIKLNNNTNITVASTSLLELWNSKNIILHQPTKDLLEKLDKAIKKKKLTHEKVAQSIENYAKVLQSSDCYFNYKWTFLIFLKREGAEAFWPENFVYENYLRHKPEAMDRTEQEMDSLVLYLKNQE